MTNYDKWSKQAKDMVREMEEDDEAAKKENDKKLGLEGGPKGPPTEKAEREVKEMGAASDQRKEFISWKEANDVLIRNQKGEDHPEPIVLGGPDEDYHRMGKLHLSYGSSGKLGFDFMPPRKFNGKSIKFRGCENMTYIVPEWPRKTQDECVHDELKGWKGIIKLHFEKCKKITLRVKNPIITGTIEVAYCADMEFDFHVPVGTVQVDECKAPVLINYHDEIGVGQIYHQNCPQLHAGWGGKLHVIGNAEHKQYYTKLGNPSDANPLLTQLVRRGEGDFPMDMGNNDGGYKKEPEAEADPEYDRLRGNVIKQHEKGNACFKASDFLQAAMEYTQALNEIERRKKEDPDLKELIPVERVATLYSNRSQCRLKIGQLEQALEDADACIKADPTQAKGWFRKGMSLHAMADQPGQHAKYHEALPFYREAEKIEPKNEQIYQAIKFSELMFRKKEQERLDKY